MKSSSHKLRILVIHGKGIFSFFRYSPFYILNCSINFKSYDVVMRVTTQGRVCFWVYLLNRKSLVMKLDRLIDISMGNIYRKNFVLFAGLGLYQPIRINQKSMMMSRGFLLHWRCALRRPKITKHHLLKINKSHIVSNLLKTQKSPEQVSSLHNSGKQVRNVYQKLHSIWPYFTLIIPKCKQSKI